MIGADCLSRAAHGRAATARIGGNKQVGANSWQDHTCWDGPARIVADGSIPATVVAIWARYASMVALALFNGGIGARVTGAAGGGPFLTHKLANGRRAARGAVQALLRPSTTLSQPIHW